MERQWAVGQLVDTGHRLKNSEGKMVPNRMIIAGADNNIYTGCLVYVDEKQQVGTMSVRFFQSYSALIIEQTALAYQYSSQDKLRADIGLFGSYFKPVAVDVPEN